MLQLKYRKPEWRNQRGVQPSPGMCESERMAQSVIAARRGEFVLGYGACALASCLWGTGFFFGKIALTEMSVPHMVLCRFFFACVVLMPLVWVHPARLNGTEWRVLLLASFLGVPVQFLVQFYGLSLTTVSHAALMVGTMPVLLALAASLFAHERLDAVGWVALGGSTAGVALIVLGGTPATSDGGGPSIAGDLLVVLSLVVALAWVLLNKRLMLRHPPVVVTAYGILCGTAMLAVVVLTTRGTPPLHGVNARVWLALAASGVLCTASTTLLWNWGIHRVPASRAGVFLNLEPALGSILGVQLLGDRLGPFAWVGGGLIVSAAVIISTRGHSESAAILE
jgi:drug/metabolite transporter (DMT)-like permease